MACWAFPATDVQPAGLPRLVAPPLDALPRAHEHLAGLIPGFRRDGGLRTGDRNVKNLLVLVILGAIAWYGYGKYKAMAAPEAAAEAPSPAAALHASSAASPAAPQFRCDGRTHCSQMRSCAEATYFLQHCPNTKMDGDQDGVPCEQQWCN